jgi:hypothetical protein
MDNRVVRLAELVAAGIKARVSLLAKVFFVVLLLLGLLEESLLLFLFIGVSFPFGTFPICCIYLLTKN